MERTRANFKGNGSFQSLIHLIPGASSGRLNIVYIQIINIIRRLETMLKIFTIPLHCFGNALFQPVPDIILSNHKDGCQSMAYLRYIAVLNKMRYTPLATDAHTRPMPYALCPREHLMLRSKGYREDADYLHRLYHWKQRSPFQSNALSWQVAG